MPDTPFQPQLDFSPHNNQSLFSDHYLQEILRRTAVWRDMQGPAGNFLAWLQDLYALEGNQLANYNESQLEDNWIKPILDRLGHVWEGQASIPGLTRTIKKPDFALFPDEMARQTAVPHQNTPNYVKDVLALLEAKKWTVNLSKKSGPLPRFDDQNPMYQIDTYLGLSGVTWGVVSNGRFWRLVHKNSSRTLETHFEIDLLAALEAPNDRSALAVATFFWAFFNQGAFRPDAHGHTFLDDALSQSKAYAIALEADLRDNAYRSLEQLIIGFFAGDTRLDAQNADHRAQVYQNSLYLLYRLLFLFYGEARALLPMGNPTYKDAYSLQTLASDFHRQRDRLDSHPTTGRRHWDRLQELFRLISGRDAQFNAELGVPRYNGGLFDPEQHPFLERHFVGDRGLAKAIDYLAYRRVREDGRFQGYQSVDYRTLDVRQLGSIYEGLLEYKVAVATEEMVTVRQKGVETWLPARQSKAAPLDRRQPGELYLTNDKGERKATGSYYTPDYIVEYIVANTLGPLVQQARERVKAQVRQTGSLSEAERRRQSAQLFVQEILALNVLDPAMGSGHFLVEATNFLARALATDEYASPEVTVTSSGTGAQAAAFQVTVTSTPIDPETDLLYWKRRVVEACIYGVDKNPMAVELAKLSLWLKTAAADKPLSFLDHHLQHGDSLIGAWLDDLQAPPHSKTQSPISDLQSPLFNDAAFTRDASLAVKGVATIERLPTLDIEDVHAKEAAWQDIQHTHVARWQTLADLWVSAYFGNAMTQEEYRALAAHLQHFPGNSEFPGKSPTLLSDAQLHHFLQHPAVTDNEYFHWELAFPEVFFDEYGRSRRAAAGFDAVIGNPPYVRQEQMAAIKPFLPHAYEPVYKGTADLYVYFLNGGINWLRAGGFLSYIVNNKWLRAGYGDGLRGFLAKEALVKGVVDFGHAPIFADADTFPCILVLQKPESEQEIEKNKTEICIFPREELENVDVSQFVVANSFSVSSKRFGEEPWSLEPEIVEDLMEKVRQRGVALSEFIGQKPYYGIKTGFNQAFLIDSDTRAKLIQDDPGSAEIIHPYLRGQDIKRWSSEWMELWMILLKSSENYQWPWSEAQDEAESIFAQTYPSIHKYLMTHVDRLKQRQDQGRFWWELRSCSYYEVFEKPTIIHTDITWRPQFAFSPDPIYLLNTAYLWPTDDLYLLAVVN
ncbi:MAG: Eco57I restriction-modification methylase domain-containing protein [Anaerolineaceae bacterium]|nr:Eco57I restriction-modification methylase domain-containing protein [Anaerolineaceae bacterium]